MNNKNSKKPPISFIITMVITVIAGLLIYFKIQEENLKKEQLKNKKRVILNENNGDSKGRENRVKERKEKKSKANESAIISLGADGKLKYKPFDDSGDIIPDFSMCGYMGGGVKLPNVPVKITLKPGNGVRDDSARIQDAINKLSKSPIDSNGFRGTILLKRGTFVVSEPISIAANGIVLRGEGQGKTGTTLYANAKKGYTVLSISSKSRLKHDNKTQTAITDSYVPIGATTFSVQDATKYKVGTKIIVTRICTKKWLDFIGMSNLTKRYNNERLKNWTPKSYTFKYFRIITAINGNKITVNAPIVEPISKKFGGGFITKINDRRLNQCGIENLRVISSFDRNKLKRGRDINSMPPESKILIYQDKEHASVAVQVSNALNCWVRNITAIYIGKSVIRTSGSTFITVQDCALLDPVNLTKGGTKYSFCNGSQLCLFQRLYSRNARHDYTLAPRTGGPNVFLHCFSDYSINASESHHRYGHGGLYDSCVLRGRGIFLAVNRGNSGSGHGWAGAMIMIWNCAASFNVVAKPPTSQNFSIGWSKSEKSSEEVIERIAGHIEWLTKRSLKTFEYKGVPVFGDGYIESPDKPVKPNSLFLQQLKDRLGEQAVKNITVPWQRKPVDANFTPKIGQEPPYKN